jgi:hypothetical protein
MDEYKSYVDGSIVSSGLASVTSSPFFFNKFIGMQFNPKNLSIPLAPFF